MRGCCHCAHVDVTQEKTWLLKARKRKYAVTVDCFSIFNVVHSNDGSCGKMVGPASEIPVNVFMY
jgi:hypothetical protein